MTNVIFSGLYWFDFIGLYWSQFETQGVNIKNQDYLFLLYKFVVSSCRGWEVETKENRKTIRSGHCKKTYEFIKCKGRIHFKRALSVDEIQGEPELNKNAVICMTEFLIVEI